MSFHLSIIGSGRTESPAGSAGSNSSLLNRQYACAADKPPADRPKDGLGLTLDRVLDTRSITGGFDFNRR